MKKHEVWTIYVQKNPKFATSGSQITFTEVGIYQFFERTWDLAHSEGMKKGREQSAKEPGSHGSDLFGDVFGGLFGKR